MVDHIGEMRIDTKFCSSSMIVQMSGCTLSLLHSKTVMAASLYQPCVSFYVTYHHIGYHMDKGCDGIYHDATCSGNH